MSKKIAVVLFCLLSAFALAQNQPQSFVMTSTGSPCATARAQNNSTVGIMVSGAFTGTLTPTLSISQVSGSPTTPVSVTGTAIGSTPQATITAAGGFTAKVGGFTQFSLCPTAFSSGTATVTLFATQATGTPNASNGANNPTTVGQGGVWSHAGIPFGFVSNSTTVTPTSGTMFWQQLNLPFTQPIGHFTAFVSTGGTAESLVVCLYNSTGTTLLWSANTTVNSTAVAVTGAATQYIAAPGQYIFAYEQLGTTGAVLQGLSLSGPMETLMNLNGGRIGTTGNTVSVTTCPATTGTLTATATNVVPLIALEP